MFCGQIIWRHKYASFCNAPFSTMQSNPKKFMIHLTQLNTVSSSHVQRSTRMMNILHVNKYATSTVLNPNHRYPSTLTWKHRASLQSLCINFGGESSTIATLMIAVLHVLLYSIASHCWILSSHITYTHVNTQICILLQCTIFKNAEHPWKVYNTFNTAQHCLIKSCQMKNKNTK